MSDLDATAKEQQGAAQAAARLLERGCPYCGADEHKLEVRNHDLMWHEGDVCCTVCDKKVRDFDAG